MHSMWVLPAARGYILRGSRHAGAGAFLQHLQLVHATRLRPGYSRRLHSESAGELLPRSRRCCRSRRADTPRSIRPGVLPLSAQHDHCRAYGRSRASQPYVYSSIAARRKSLLDTLPAWPGRYARMAHAVRSNSYWYRPQAALGQSAGNTYCRSSWQLCRRSLRTPGKTGYTRRPLRYAFCETAG